MVTRVDVSSARSGPDLKKVIAALDRRVAQADLAAMFDLGMWLQGAKRDLDH